MMPKEITKSNYFKLNYDRAAYYGKDMRSRASHLFDVEAKNVKSNVPTVYILDT